MNLKIIFTWWNSQTLGTFLKTLIFGKYVGRDEFGNKYYKNKEDERWVIYSQDIEATKITSDWFMWMHHTPVDLELLVIVPGTCRFWTPPPKPAGLEKPLIAQTQTTRNSTQQRRPVSQLYLALLWKLIFDIQEAKETARVILWRKVPRVHQRAKLALLQWAVLVVRRRGCLKMIFLAS